MLLETGYPPIALKHDAKQDYKKALEEWQVHGNPKIFLDIVNNCVMDELKEYIKIVSITRETIKNLEKNNIYKKLDERPSYLLIIRS